MNDTPETAAKAYFGRNAAHYATSPAHTEAATLARLVALAAPQADWRVLDIATGAGHTAFAFAPHVAEVVATDLTPEMLAQARRLAAKQGHENLIFQECDVHALPWPAASFDAVTCRRAAHHFARIDTALSEMRRVLKPGGRLVLDDRSVPEDPVADRLLNHLDTLHDRSHVRQYPVSAWETMLANHEFQIESIESYWRSRPLAAFTTGALPEDQAAVRRIAAGFGAEERAALGYKTREDEIYLDHWYVIAVAANTFCAR